MGLFSRTSAAAEAVHARVSDGDHLWLAVSGAELPLALVDSGTTGAVLAVTTETDGDLETAVVPLAAAWPDGVDALRLVHGRKQKPVVAALTKRPAGPTLAAPVTRDGHWQLAVQQVDGAVVVTRTPAAAGVAVLGLAAAAGGVEVRLVDGRSVLVGSEPGPVLVDGVPVVRGRNVLDRPNFAVTLPPLASDGLELRWSMDGRLTVVER